MLKKLLIWIVFLIFQYVQMPILAPMGLKLVYLISYSIITICRLKNCQRSYFWYGKYVKVCIFLQIHGALIVFSYFSIWQANGSFSVFKFKFHLISSFCQWKDILPFTLKVQTKYTLSLRMALECSKWATFYSNIRYLDPWSPSRVFPVHWQVWGTCNILQKCAQQSILTEQV